MFDLKDHLVEVTNVNHRTQNHGDKKKLAYDLKIECNCHARVLDNFDGLLRQLFYRAPGAGEQQRLAVDVDPDELTELRNTRLAPLKHVEDFPGYKLTFLKGMGLSKPMVLDQVTLSGFTFEALDGGSVFITFRASGLEPADSKNSLPRLLLDVSTLTLEPPEATEFPQAGQQVGDLAEDASKLALVTGVEFKKQKNQLVKTFATLSDGRRIECDEVAYDPKPEHVLDLLKFAGVDAQIAPAVVSDWPKAA